MFEHYTEKARRVIFFARYEACQFGSPLIEPEHLLLAILRESRVMPERSQHPDVSGALLVRHKQFIRKRVEEHSTIRELISASVDLLLSAECREVLAYAADEAERLCDEHIGLDHLLLGLLREENCFATKLLNERGVLLADARAQIESQP